MEFLKLKEVRPKKFHKINKTRTVHKIVHSSSARKGYFRAKSDEFFVNLSHDIYRLFLHKLLDKK